MANSEIMQSLIEDVFTPLNGFYANKIHSDSSFHKLFGVYKIALLPIYKDENYNTELNKLLKIYTNKNLILDEDTKNFFEMFLFLYFNWLRKYKHKSLVKFSRLLEIEKFLEINDFNNLTIKIEDFKIVNSTELINTEGIDKDVLLDLEDVIKEYKILSKDDELFNGLYFETFSKFINELISFLRSYDEFGFLIMIFEKFIKFFENIDYDNLDVDKNKEIKIIADETVDFIKQWISNVFFDKKEMDITYLDAFILSEIAKLEIINSK